MIILMVTLVNLSGITVRVGSYLNFLHHSTGSQLTVDLGYLQSIGRSKTGNLFSDRVERGLYVYLWVSCETEL